MYPLGLDECLRKIRILFGNMIITQSSSSLFWQQNKPKHRRKILMYVRGVCTNVKIFFSSFENLIRPNKDARMSVNVSVS